MDWVPLQAVHYTLRCSWAVCVSLGVPAGAAIERDLAGAAGHSVRAEALGTSQASDHGMGPSDAAGTAVAVLAVHGAVAVAADQSVLAATLGGSGTLAAGRRAGREGLLAAAVGASVHGEAAHAGAAAGIAVGSRVPAESVEASGHGSVWSAHPSAASG